MNCFPVSRTPCCPRVGGSGHTQTARRGGKSISASRGESSFLTLAKGQDLAPSSHLLFFLSRASFSVKGTPWFFQGEWMRFRIEHSEACTECAGDWFRDSRRSKPVWPQWTSGLFQEASRCLGLHLEDYVTARCHHVELRVSPKNKARDRETGIVGLKNMDLALISNYAFLNHVSQEILLFPCKPILVSFSVF